MLLHAVIWYDLCMSSSFSVHVRGSETRAGSSIAATAWFDRSARRCEFGFAVQTTRAPARSRLLTSILTSLDAYDGATNPMMRFNDGDYSFVAGAQRMILPKLESLGILGVTFAVHPSEQDAKTSTITVATEDRQPLTIELEGTQFVVDPAEFAATGLVVACQTLKQVEIVTLQGGVVGAEVMA